MTRIQCRCKRWVTVSAMLTLSVLVGACERGGADSSGVDVTEEGGAKHAQLPVDNKYADKSLPETPPHGRSEAGPHSSGGRRH
jgi:hypothetical protein